MRFRPSHLGADTVSTSARLTAGEFVQATAEELLSNADVRVWYRSNLHPPVNLYDANWNEPASWWSQFWMKLTQPAVTIESKYGVKHYAPYGEPTEDYSPLIFGASIAIGGFAFYGFKALFDKGLDR